MRAVHSWLREMVPGLPDAQACADALTEAGLKVESVELLGFDVAAVDAGSGVVVGEVVSIEELTEFKKPIRFVEVRLSEGGPLRGIVCGATNFVVGDRVPVALPGAVLPGGFAIGARETYGRISDGMICSARELGLGDDHRGILVLPEATPAGRRCAGTRGLARCRPRHRGHDRPWLCPFTAGNCPRTGDGVRPGIPRPCCGRAARTLRSGGRGPYRGRAGMQPLRPSPDARRFADQVRRVVACRSGSPHRRGDAAHLAHRRRHQPRPARDRAAVARVRRRQARGRCRRAAGEAGGAVGNTRRRRPNPFT